MTELSRREALAGASALLAASAAVPALGRGASAQFVRRDGSALRIGPNPYRYAGTNMWYAAYLGANAPYGNRDRLKRELDRLVALGIQSIRILGSSELSPLKNSVTSDVSRPEQQLQRGAARGPRLRARRNGQARAQGGDLPDQFLGMVGRDDDLSLLDQRRPLHQHERPGASVAGIPRHELGLLRQPAGDRDARTTISAPSSAGPTASPAAAIADDPAIHRGSSPTSRDRAAARSRPAAHARLSRLDRRHRAPDQVDRPQPHGLDRKRGDAGLHRERQLRRRRALARRRSTTSPRTSGRRTGAGPTPRTWPAPGRPSRSNTRDYIARQVGDRAARSASRW